jgi:hypothetical protein
MVKGNGCVGMGDDGPHPSVLQLTYLFQAEEGESVFAPGLPEGKAVPEKFAQQISHGAIFFRS